MSIADLIHRRPVVPWEGTTKIPWSDPDFSTRMLHVHLDQAQSGANRPFHVIDDHVAWIDAILGTPSRVLDLGCGPGFYMSRLAGLGHDCVGVDFSPAAIDYARANDPHSEYRLADLTDAAFDRDFDLVMMVYGEFNTFAPPVAASLLEHMAGALRAGGRLLLEVHDADFVAEQGRRAPHWFTAESGLFSARPHVCVRESHWHETAAVATDRYLIIDAETQDVKEMVNTLQSYPGDGLNVLLHEAGLQNVEHHPSLGGEPTDGLTVTTARNPD